MKLKIKYFGVIAEKALKESETLELDKALTANELRLFLERKYGLDSIQFSLAINKEMNANVHLEENDEVALLPPFAGG